MAVKVMLYPLTGDTVSTEIEWELAGFVSLADRRDHMSSDEVEFADTVTGRHTDSYDMESMSFDEWAREYEINRKRVEALEDEAIELAREKVAGEYEAAADHAYDARRDAELEGR